MTKALTATDFSPLIVTAGALIREGQVLVQQRPAGKPLAGLWEFPGGKVEAGETPATALARELAEELGVTLDPALLVPIGFGCGEAGGRPLLLLLHHVPTWQGEPRALHASALRWVQFAALYELMMPEPDRPLVAALTAWFGGGRKMEARAGIEPACKDLQSSA